MMRKTGKHYLLDGYVAHCEAAPKAIQSWDMMLCFNPNFFPILAVVLIGQGLGLRHTKQRKLAILLNSGVLLAVISQSQ